MNAEDTLAADSLEASPWHAAVIAVLAEECGASFDALAVVGFSLHFPGCREWRFGGTLGCGGKVRAEHGRIFVDCYPEDRTPERDAAIARANARLALIDNPERTDA